VLLSGEGWMQWGDVRVRAKSEARRRGVRSLGDGTAAVAKSVAAGKRHGYA
jgi:hypothetical protein